LLRAARALSRRHVTSAIAAIFGLNPIDIVDQNGQIDGTPLEFLDEKTNKKAALDALAKYHGIVQVDRRKNLERVHLKETKAAKTPLGEFPTAHVPPNEGAGSFCKIFHPASCRSCTQQLDLVTPDDRNLTNLQRFSTGAVSA